MPTVDSTAPLLVVARQCGSGSFDGGSGTWASRGAGIRR